MDKLNDLFIEGGVYKLKSVRDENITICESLSGIGKLTLYEFLGDNLYMKTSTQFFLNNYKEGDIKELFTQRENYDLVGILGNNYIKSNTNEYVIRK